MKILISGSSGLVGTHLIDQLRAAGHEPVSLVRNRERAGVYWDPRTYALDDPAVLETFDAVIHLAGESIVGRWTAAKKDRIRSSRIDSTTVLARAMAGCASPPSVFIVASAIGYYGDTGDRAVDEDAPLGIGFLAEVCRDWEAAADPARGVGIRVVHMRFGMLLSPRGGALKTMLPPFRAGLGGRVGTGTQSMSWASLDDAVGAILHALNHADLSGPVNVVSPQPCTNLEFTKALGQALNRLTVFPVPAFLVRLLFGEMGDALLLASQRVMPNRLLKTGYSFQDANLGHALARLLD